MADDERTTGPDGSDGLRGCPIGIVPLGWPSPRADLDGFLSAIADLGFAGIQFGDPGPQPEALRERLDHHGVVVAERYFPIECTTDGPADTARAAGSAHLQQLVAMGGRMLVAAVDGTHERDRFTGRGAAAPTFTDEGWTRLADLLDDLAAEAAEHGVDTTFHPHGGTYVETPAETERLLAATDPDLVGLCLDTGHWLVGGGDALEAIDAYAGRIRHVHLKDADPDVVDGLRTGRVPTMTAAIEEEIVFAPLGTGLLPLDAVLHGLAANGYRGWLMVEQDTFEGTPQEAAAHSRRVLADALTRQR